MPTVEARPQRVTFDGRYTQAAQLWVTELCASAGSPALQLTELLQPEILVTKIKL